MIPYRKRYRAAVPALASTIAVEFPEAGPVLSAMVIGPIVLNEASGPFFLRSALITTGEAVPEHEMLD